MYLIELGLIPLKMIFMIIIEIILKKDKIFFDYLFVDFLNLKIYP